MVSRSFDESKPTNLPGNANVTEILQPTMAMPLPAVRNFTVTDNKSNRSSIFGLVGLLAIIVLISGGLVWAAISIVAANRSAETVTVQKDESGNKSAEQNTDKKVKPNNKESSGKKDSGKTIVTNTKTPEITKPAKVPRLSRFNGRVIMLNAVLRTAPTMEAGDVEILQLDEPLIIGNKASGNSPWYRVETASGAKGWMHGNTIEFN